MPLWTPGLILGLKSTSSESNLDGDIPSFLPLAYCLEKSQSPAPSQRCGAPGAGNSPGWKMCHRVGHPEAAGGFLVQLSARPEEKPVSSHQEWGQAGNGEAVPGSSLETAQGLLAPRALTDG